MSVADVVGVIVNDIASLVVHAELVVALVEFDDVAMNIDDVVDIVVVLVVDDDVAYDMKGVVVVAVERLAHDAVDTSVGRSHVVSNIDDAHLKVHVDVTSVVDGTQAQHPQQ